MNATEVIFFLLFFIIGLMLIYTGWSILKYNSSIAEVQGVIKDQAPISGTGSNCLVLPDGTSICNYIVTYNFQDKSNTTTVGSFSSYKVGDSINLYIDSENENVSTITTVVSDAMGWFYIILGVINFLFLFYYVYISNKKRCMENNLGVNKFYIY